MKISISALRQIIREEVTRSARRRLSEGWTVRSGRNKTLVVSSEDPGVSVDITYFGSDANRLQETELEEIEAIVDSNQDASEDKMRDLLYNFGN